MKKQKLISFLMQKRMAVELFDVISILTVYWKKGIKTVKSINLLVIVWMISVVQSFKVIL